MAHFSLFNTKSILYISTVLFQTVQFSVGIAFIYTQLNVKTILFQTIQFSIGTEFSSISSINGTRSGATTPSQSGHGSNGNEGILRIPESSSITGLLPSISLVSYSGNSLEESYSFAEK